MHHLRKCWGACLGLDLSNKEPCHLVRLLWGFSTEHAVGSVPTPGAFCLLGAPVLRLCCAVTLRASTCGHTALPHLPHAGQVQEAHSEGGQLRGLLDPECRHRCCPRARHQLRQQKLPGGPGLSCSAWSWVMETKVWALWLGGVFSWEALSSPTQAWALSHPCRTQTRPAPPTHPVFFLIWSLGGGAFAAVNCQWVTPGCSWSPLIYEKETPGFPQHLV